MKIRNRRLQSIIVLSAALSSSPIAWAQPQQSATLLGAHSAAVAVVLAVVDFGKCLGQMRYAATNHFTLGHFVLQTDRRLFGRIAGADQPVVIAGGMIQYDGSLAGVIESFSRYKVVTLQLSDVRDESELAGIEDIESVELPRIQLRIDKSEVAAKLAMMLQRFNVADVVVEDPPLEDVIASLFSQVAAA